MRIYTKRAYLKRPSDFHCGHKRGTVEATLFLTPTFKWCSECGSLVNRETGGVAVPTISEPDTYLGDETP